jgi:hypothetical protein
MLSVKPIIKTSYFVGIKSTIDLIPTKWEQDAGKVKNIITG